MSRDGHRMRWHAIAALAVVLAASTGCGSTGAGSAPNGSLAASGSSTAATTPTAVENLTVTDRIRAQLLAEGAALHKLPTADYTGLVKGETYYAYDPSSKTYWAGAGLVAKPGATQAQIGNQDDGAYLLFERAAGGSWKAYPAGIPGSTQFICMVKPPTQVDAVWGWAAGTCHPPHG